MKRVIRLLVLTTLLVTPNLAPASEQVGVYIAPKLSYGYLLGYDFGGRSFDGDSVFGGALAVGYDFGKNKGLGVDLPIRFELEFAMFSSANNKWDAWELETGVSTLFINAYYDFNLGKSSAFTPYVGFGLGLAFVDVDLKLFSTKVGNASGTNFAWNIGAGVAYTFTDSVPLSIDLGYRFAGLGNGPTYSGHGGGSGDSLYMHQVMLGLRYTF